MICGWSAGKSPCKSRSLKNVPSYAVAVARLQYTAMVPLGHLPTQIPDTQTPKNLSQGLSMTVAGRSLKGMNHQGWSDTADMTVVVYENVACHCFSR